MERTECRPTKHGRLQSSCNVTLIHLLVIARERSDRGDLVTKQQEIASIGPSLTFETGLSQ